MSSGTTQRISGIFLLSMGALLLMGAFAYFGYGVFARSQLGRLNYEAERPGVLAESYSDVSNVAGGEAGAATLSDKLGGSEPDTAAGSSQVGALSAGLSASVDARDGDTVETGLSADQEPISTTGDRSATAIGAKEAARASSSDQLQGNLGRSVEDSLSPPDTGEDQALTLIEAGAQGGSQVQRSAGSTSPSPAATSAPESGTSGSAGFGASGTYAFAFGAGASTEDPAIAMIAARIEASKLEASSYAAPTGLELIGDKGAATRIRIPAINVDTVVRDLKVVYSAQSSAWETPKHVVGHIPTTGRPGAGGQGWYFGHLESPIRGEGNVFSRLPEIPELAKGSPIYVFLETDGVKYVYQVYQTSVLHQDDLQITDSGERDITLVTCTPRLYYDHRLLVTAALVGFSKSDPNSETSS